MKLTFLFLSLIASLLHTQAADFTSTSDYKSVDAFLTAAGREIEDRLHEHHAP